MIKAYKWTLFYILAKDALTWEDIPRFITNWREIEYFMSSFPVPPPLCLSLLHMLINAVEEFCLSDRRAYKQGWINLTRDRLL